MNYAIIADISFQKNLSMDVIITAPKWDISLQILILNPVRFFSLLNLIFKLEETLLNDLENNESLPYLYKWNEGICQSFWVQKVKNLENNEYICERKYCANCLKSNYDINIHHMKTDHKWLCPFCKVTFSKNIYILIIQFRESVFVQDVFVMIK